MGSVVFQYIGLAYTIVTALALVVPKGSKSGQLLARIGSDLKSFLPSK